MKIKKLILTMVIGMMTLVHTAHAYEAPTDGQITSLLANPKLITQILGDASGKEAAALMKQIIDRVLATNMAQKQKDYLIAFYSGRIASLLNEEEAGQFATELVSVVPAESLATVFAGLSAGRGGETFLTLLKDLAGDNESLNTAISTPNITLTDPVHTLLVGNLANAQSISPAPIDSVPPPGDGTGTTGGAAGGADGGGETGGGGGTTPPPVVPPGYAGQG